MANSIGARGDDQCFVFSSWPRLFKLRKNKHSRISASVDVDKWVVCWRPPRSSRFLESLSFHGFELFRTIFICCSLRIHDLWSDKLLSINLKSKLFLWNLKCNFHIFVMFSNFTKLDLEKNFIQQQIQLWHVFHGLLPSKIYHFARSDKLEFRTVPGMYDKVANIGPRSGAQAAKHGTLICYRKMAICYQWLKNDFTFCWIDSRHFFRKLKLFQSPGIRHFVVSSISALLSFVVVPCSHASLVRYKTILGGLQTTEAIWEISWSVETIWSDDIFMFCGHELLNLNAAYQKIFMFPTNETTKYIIGIPRYEQIQARF